MSCNADNDNAERFLTNDSNIGVGRVCAARAALEWIYNEYQYQNQWKSIYNEYIMNNLMNIVRTPNFQSPNPKKSRKMADVSLCPNNLIN